MYLVILAILVGELQALGAKMFLHERIDHNLFSNGVASDLPEQLISPALLGVRLSSVLDILVVVFVHLES